MRFAAAIFMPLLGAAHAVLGAPLTLIAPAAANQEMQGARVHPRGWEAIRGGGAVKTEFTTDVCVYGATGAGINAAVAAAREGYSVLIVEPSHKLGGLLGTGFRLLTDVPYADHLGGLTGELYKEDISQARQIQGDREFNSYSGSERTVDMDLYVRVLQSAGKFNVTAFREMLDEYGDLIRVITNHRLAAVNTSNGKIDEAVFEYAPPDENGVPLPHRASDNLTKVKAAVFIDASYEGDLMAYSGVSYRVAKESAAEYGESLAGIRRISKPFRGISPYKEKGNPSSGYLYPITKLEGEAGDASDGFMLYNFKLAWEESPTPEQPGFPVKPPEKQNADIYELLKRYTDAGYKVSWPDPNFRRDEIMTGSIPGLQLNYPEGDWATRSKIWRDHIDHVRTLTDFTGKELWLSSAQNESTNGWPHLYIRQARRMVGEYVMTQKDIQLQTDVPHPIGMGYYKIDIYPNRLVALDDETIAYEGVDLVLASPGPYQIPYAAIIPKKSEIANLLVPVCMSASHIAYSSIRMEATYMVMGESAGIAATIALKHNEAVQNIDRKELTDKLKEYGQKLEWDGKGYRKWRYDALIVNKPLDETERWETHPEEYARYPIDVLWK